jgi:hypothetical protein
MRHPRRPANLDISRLRRDRGGPLPTARRQGSTRSLRTSARRHPGRDPVPGNPNSPEPPTQRQVPAPRSCRLQDVLFAWACTTFNLAKTTPCP